MEDPRHVTLGCRADDMRNTIVATLALVASTAAFSPAARPRAPTRLGAASAATAPLDRAHERLAGVSVLRAADGAPVDVTSLWSSDQRAVVAFFRSFG